MHLQTHIPGDYLATCMHISTVYLKIIMTKDKIVGTVIAFQTCDVIINTDDDCFDTFKNESLKMSVVLPRSVTWCYVHREKVVYCILS